jgi:hypothetical protein
MTIFFDNEGTRYLPGVPFTYGDINYTSAGATAETFLALGFKEVVPQPRPDDRFYVVNSYPKEDGSWEVQPRDLHQLIEQHIAQVKQAAASVLQPTDWKIIREVEGGSPAGAELKAWRKSIRDESDVKVAAIEGATTVEALIAVVTAADFLAWPEQDAPAPKKAATPKSKTR